MFRVIVALCAFLVFGLYLTLSGCETKSGCLVSPETGKLESCGVK